MTNEELYGKLEQIMIARGRKFFREQYPEELYNTDFEQRFLAIYQVGCSEGISIMKEITGNFILLNGVAAL